MISIPCHQGGCSWPQCSLQVVSHEDRKVLYHALPPLFVSDFRFLSWWGFLGATVAWKTSNPRPARCHEVLAVFRSDDFQVTPSFGGWTTDQWMDGFWGKPGNHEIHHEFMNHRFFFSRLLNPDRDREKKPSLFQYGVTDFLLYPGWWFATFLYISYFSIPIGSMYGI